MPHSIAFRFALLLAGSCFVGAAISAADDPTKENGYIALGGTYGDDGDDYFFESLSAKKRDDNLFRYVYLIKNTHGKNLLYAEWPSADISFQGINPNSRAKNQFTSSKSFEELKSRLKFGHKKPLMEKAVQMFGVDDKQQGKNADLGSLVSSIEARLTIDTLEPKEVVDIDVTFVCQLEKTISKQPSKMIYKVANNSKSVLFLKFDGLFDAANEADGVLMRSLPLEPLESKDSFRLALNNETKEKSIPFTDQKFFREQLFSVSIAIDRLGPQVAKGKISLYVPTKGLK